MELCKDGFPSRDNCLLCSKASSRFSHCFFFIKFYLSLPSITSTWLQQFITYHAKTRNFLPIHRPLDVTCCSVKTSTFLQNIPKLFPRIYLIIIYQRTFTFASMVYTSKCVLNQPLFKADRSSKIYYPSFNPIPVLLNLKFKSQIADGTC